jgi:excisionase family DNA binding protein
VLRELPPEELPGLLGEIEQVRYTAIARLTAPPLSTFSEHDQLLDVKEAAPRLKVGEDYLYKHAKEFPFTRRMGRKVLFSSAGIDRYIQQQDSLTAKRLRLTLRSL